MDYRIIRSGRRTVAVQIKGGEVLVRAPFSMSDGEIRDFVERHADKIENYLEKAEQREKELDGVNLLSDSEKRQLAEQATRILPKRVEYYARLLGVTYGRITVRAQRTRWGSCSSGGNLNFNYLLMLAPPEVLDSVVAHELCHRKQMNHSDKFYAELLRVCPDYHKHNAWLKQNGAYLFRRGGLV